MPQQFKPARLDLKATVITGLFVVLILYLAFFIDGPILFRVVFPLLLFLLTGVFAVRGYAIEADALVVQHFFWQRRFPLADLRAATFDPGAMSGSLRTFGIGGAFGYLGRFHNRHLGGYLAYVTDGRQTIVLRFTDRVLVISPADPAAFLQQLPASVELA